MRARMGSHEKRLGSNGIQERVVLSLTPAASRSATYVVPCSTTEIRPLPGKILPAATRSATDCVTGRFRFLPMITAWVDHSSSRSLVVLAQRLNEHTRNDPGQADAQAGEYHLWHAAGSFLNKHPRRRVPTCQSRKMRDFYLCCSWPAGSLLAKVLLTGQRLQVNG